MYLLTSGIKLDTKKITSRKLKLASYLLNTHKYTLSEPFYYSLMVRWLTKQVQNELCHCHQLLENWSASLRGLMLPHALGIQNFCHKDWKEEITWQSSWTQVKG